MSSTCQCRSHLVMLCSAPLSNAWTSTGGEPGLTLKCGSDRRRSGGRTPSSLQKSINATWQAGQLPFGVPTNRDATFTWSGVLTGASGYRSGVAAQGTSSLPSMAAWLPPARSSTSGLADRCQSALKHAHWPTHPPGAVARCRGGRGGRGGGGAPPIAQWCGWRLSRRLFPDLATAQGR